AIRDLAGGSRQGGSTITMQLIKNLCHPTAERTLGLKLEEAYLAKSYEKTHSKRAIITRYLNGVFYGNNAVGVQAASLTYFSKPVRAITLPQAALLAAPAPGGACTNPSPPQGRRYAPPQRGAAPDGGGRLHRPEARGQGDACRAGPPPRVGLLRQAAGVLRRLRDGHPPRQPRREEGE